MGFSYVEGSSWSGWEAKDMAYMGGRHDKALKKGEGDDEPHDDIDPDQAREYQFELDFICQTKLTGLFKDQLADGILGMDNSRNAYWHQAMRANVSDASAFSLCFARQPTASRQGTEAGAFSLGGFDKRLHNENSPVVYIPFDSQNRMFDVDLKGIYLRKGGGGDSAESSDPSLPIVSLGLTEAELSGSGIVTIDSGTTDTYLPRRFVGDFERVWTEMTDVPYHHSPMMLTPEQLNQLPTILFQMEGDYAENRKLGSDPYPLGTLGSAFPDANRSMIENFDVVVAMPPSHYMEYRDGLYINRLYIDESFGSTLGANFMMGHDITFDIENGRIGWAESVCDYLGLLNEFNEPNPWENPEDNDDDETTPGVDGTGKENSKEASNKQNGNANKDQDSSNPWSAGVTIVIVATTMLGAAAGVYGKRYYDRHHFQYQVTASELELQDASEQAEEYVTPISTIS